MLYANGTVPDFKRKHEKEWNQLFHRELAKNLTSFGYDPEKEYPFKQFQKDMKDLYVCYLNYSFVRTMVRISSILCSNDWLTLFAVGIRSNG